ncbi:hypothetical protein JNB88_14450 [Rhizobium cauense]|uniref:hypothetical protein n=1 Tax=Rhizobium cauense TaxID=1166683 RepID=UPI001C6F2125|nr:hypothetical protein [Rhizobium cauense]MBW9114841.1 hypothetical protein [Rhizobium cauense]
MEKHRSNQPKANVLTDALMASCMLSDCRALFDAATKPEPHRILNLFSGKSDPSIAASTRGLENDRAGAVRLLARRS